MSNFREKIHSKELIATFDDVLILPGFTDFSPNDVDLSSKLGKYHFNLPIFSAAMDTVTEEIMAIKMALHGVPKKDIDELYKNLNILFKMASFFLKPTVLLITIPSPF